MDKDLKRLNKVLLNKIKKKRGCALCGEKELCCLEFHHINPEDKIDSVVNMLNLPREVLLAEVKKCVVLCANCHRKVHSKILKL